MKNLDIIPAVDLLGGKVVRLVKGDPKQVKSYEHLGDPVAIARKWEAEGAKIVHIIDLDAALDLGNNVDVIEEIIQKVKVQLQVGGGIRKLEIARKLLDTGVSRILLGSLAFEKSSAVRELIKEYGADKIIIALDNLNGEIMIHGWKTLTKIGVKEAAMNFLKLGARIFLVTSVSRDGTMSGPDIDLLAEVNRLRAEVIAAGGIRNIEDIAILKKLGLQGVVVGKALYEGKITLKEALKIASD